MEMHKSGALDNDLKMLKEIMMIAKAGME